MKKLLFITTFIFVFSFAFPIFSFAQGMMGFSSSSFDNVAIQSQQQEEQEGKKLLGDLNNKIVACSQLKDADFEKIGEYFMGQSIGDISRHIAMNEMMKKMMGEKGEEQMHVAMGKRLSSCDTLAAFPSQGIGFMSMMNMMGGGSNSMMGNFGTNLTGWFGWIFMILLWVLLILSIVALIKWLIHSAHGHKKSPLEILEERYAKGEIDKKEFERIKKDLI